MSRSNTFLVAALGMLLVTGSFQQACAANKGSHMTYLWCKDQVTAKGITDTSKIQEEVHKCRKDPTTYK
jgi:hypothetical protein